jgi:protein-tyrosine kinase
MEEIREAIERAKANNAIASKRRPSVIGQANSTVRQFHAAEEAELATAHLQSQRIIAHNYQEAQSMAFDMLRTQVLQAMDLKEWRFLGITSPTPGCGKTVVAVNLALSIARLAERSVLLIDLDLRKPQVAGHLGLEPQYGIVSTLQNRSRLHDAIIPACIGDYRLAVLPAESRVSSSSDWMASSAMAEVFQTIKDQSQSQIVIVDLPPLLSSDDVLAIVPKLDCVLLVAAVGATTIPQINESKNLLHATELVRVVLNKVPLSKSAYYYGYS